MIQPGESGVVIKMGGSIVTDKGATELTLREELIRRLAQEIESSNERPIVLVHGAGSFGHQIARRTSLHLGLQGKEGRFALGETQRLQYELDSRICRILLDEGLPVMPCQASASALMDDGKLISMDVQALRLMVENEMIPLLYGVPAMDRKRGCSILSGDQIAPYVAKHLALRRIIHATDVDGVFDSDPVEHKNAKHFARVDTSNWEAVRRALSGSRSVDVTGGMAGKVESVVDLARTGVTTRIIDARIPGRLAAALAEEPVGTLVVWEVAP